MAMMTIETGSPQILAQRVEMAQRIDEVINIGSAFAATRRVVNTVQRDATGGRC